MENNTTITAAESSIFADKGFVAFFKTLLAKQPFAGFQELLLDNEQAIRDSYLERLEAAMRQPPPDWAPEAASAIDIYRKVIHETISEANATYGFNLVEEKADIKICDDIDEVVDSSVRLLGRMLSGDNSESDENKGDDRAEDVPEAKERDAEGNGNGAADK